MPISIPKKVRCLKCGKRFTVMLGDVRPQISRCPRCNFICIVFK